MALVSHQTSSGEAVISGDASSARSVFFALAFGVWTAFAA
jgi:hypothetical protein